MDKQDVKESFKVFLHSVAKEFRDGLSKAIGWSIPVALFGILISFIGGVLWPSLDISDVSCEVVKDGHVLSPDNPTDRFGKEFSIDENGIQIESNHHAPTIEIDMSGKGRIGAAYVAYDANSADNEDALQLQKITLDSPAPVGALLSPSSCSCTLNYATASNDNQFAYLMFIDKDTGERDIWCLVLEYDEDNENPNERYSIECYSEDDIYEMVPNDGNYLPVSLNLDSVKEDMSDLHKEDVY